MDHAKSAGAIANTILWSRVALAAAAAVSLLTDSLMADATPVQATLVALGLVLGVPHGALDHLLAAPILSVRTSVAAAGYAAIAAGVWAVVHWGGPIPLALMIVASVAHFGMGELETTDAAGAQLLARLAIVVSGAGALVLPLARGGPGWDDTLASLSPSLAAVLDDVAVRGTLIGMWVVCAVVSVVWFARRGRWSQVADLAVIGVVGATVAPLTAFALWFGFWHAPRHLARLVDLEVNARNVSARAALRTLALRAAPATAGALITLGVIVGVVVGSDSTTGAVAAAIVVLLALTAPHMMVVGAMDLRSHRTQASVAPRAVTPILNGVR